MLRCARHTALGTALVALAACGQGSIGDRLGGGSKTGGPSAEVVNEVGVSGVRRLSAVEYRSTVFDLVGVDVEDAALTLPTDDRTPFDNDFTKQTASQALIDGAELLSGEIAAAVVADPALRSKVVPCEPSGPADQACFESFVTGFGRRALRRDLTEAEVAAFAAHFMPHAALENDFWVAVDSGLRAFFQHPDFLYRVEIGTPVDGQKGVFALSGYEVAARLSYLLWGSTPPDWLLDAAAAGELGDPAKLREHAAKMLEDDRAIKRIGRFHSLWLSYEQLPHAPDLADAMNLETETLLKKVILEDKRPWTDLLIADETFLTPLLAEHYGLPAPAGGKPGWVPYGTSGRRGLLSHGTFLSAVAKFDDTSPTQRGLLIRTRLFCQIINKPPPELMVNADMPPQAADPNACKSERYVMWKTDGCSGCHKLMDPVGFGLESYDSAGRFRTTEPGKPQCSIDGKGTLDGVGDFTGPAELGDMMIQAGGVDRCVATMVYRYAMGRWKLDDHDDALIDRVVEAAQGGASLKFDALLAELVGSEAFRLRRDEEVAQ